MTQRIDILKSILLRLHHGASPESVQEEFNQHFKGVSAIEIAMMEQELMGADTGITFEDVMSLCNVHANLFKGVIEDVDLPDADQEGHPVRVFKEENLALRAALLRIRRIMDHYGNPEFLEARPELEKGLNLQFPFLNSLIITTPARRSSFSQLWRGMAILPRPRSCGLSMTRLGTCFKRLSQP